MFEPANDLGVSEDEAECVGSYGWQTISNYSDEPDIKSEATFKTFL